MLLFFKLQQGFSVVPDLLEGSQEVQRFPQQYVHDVGIVAVRVFQAQPGKIGGFQLRRIPFVPNDAASAGCRRPAGMLPVPQIKEVAVF